MPRARTNNGRYEGKETPKKSTYEMGLALEAIRKGEKVVHKRGLRKVDSKAVLAAGTQEAYTSQELVHMIRETYEMSRDERDWKGMYTVIQMIVQYSVGKPVHRTLSATINPGEILELLQDAAVDAAEANGEAIDLGVADE